MSVEKGVRNMNSNEIESKIRNFIKNELMVEQVEFATLDDQIDLDSLAETELRVFLSDEFGIDTDLSKVSPGSLASLGKIVVLVSQERTLNVKCGQTSHPKPSTSAV